jgi:hypothetical protein
MGMERTCLGGRDVSVLYVMKESIGGAFEQREREIEQSEVGELTAREAVVLRRVA